jgi:hypothetical protein
MPAPKMAGLRPGRQAVTRMELGSTVGRIPRGTSAPLRAAPSITHHERPAAEGSIPPPPGSRRCCVMPLSDPRAQRKGRGTRRFGRARTRSGPARTSCVPTVRDQTRPTARGRARIESSGATFPEPRGFFRDETDVAGMPHGPGASQWAHRHFDTRNSSSDPSLDGVVSGSRPTGGRRDREVPQWNRTQRAADAPALACARPLA